MKLNGTFVFDQSLLIRPNRHREYVGAYPTTNEPIRWELNIAPPAGGKVLTVAASGDQPIFYRAAGATRVDTFDITVCAKLIMDLKTSAIQTMTVEKYDEMLMHIDSLPAAARHTDLFSAIRKMPANEPALIAKLISYRPTVFGRGAPHPIFIPTEHEYNIMRTQITEPFNFIWTDIENLHTFLTTKYDIINTSNIMDYTRPFENNFDVIRKLLPHMNPGGKIIMTTCDMMWEKIAKRFTAYPQDLLSCTNAVFFHRDRIPENPSQFCAIVITKHR